MCYKIIFLCILFFYNVFSRTELSKSKCPDMFVLVQANVTNITKQQSIAMNSKFYSIYDNQYLKQSVQDIVLNDSSTYLDQFIKDRMTMYIIVVAIFTVFFITAGICCTFQQSCPPKFLKRDLKKRPYTILQFRIVTVLTLFTAIGIIIPCFIGLGFIPSLKKQAQITKCSLYIVLDAALNGQKQTGWGGFNNLYVKIQNVTQYLTQSIPSMGLYLSGNEWLIDEMQNMKQMNLNIYSNNKNARLLTPNPAKTKEALDNGFDYPMIDSRFVQKGMGPNGTANTMVTDIDKGLRTTETLSQIAHSIQIAANRVIDSSNTLLTNTNSSLQNMDMYIEQLKKLQFTMDSFSSEYLENLFYNFIKLLEGTFAIEVIAGFSCILGVVATYKFQIFKCKSLVSLAWFLFGLGFIGSMIVLFVILGMGSLGYGFCNFFDSIMTSETEFNKLSYIDSQNPFVKLDACFYGNGDVLQKFNLGQQMNTVTTLFSLIQKYYDYENEMSTNFIDKAISTGKISNWLVTIKNYQQGIYIDFDQKVTNEDNPNVALKNMNLYTKGGASTQTCAKDRWVFDKTNCTEPNETIYVTGTDANGVALETTSDAICISLNEKFSVSMNSPWTESDFTRRYTQTRQACPLAYQKTIQYGYTIIKYRDSRRNLFQGIQDELNAILSKNIAFNNNLTGFKNKVFGFEASASELNNIVSNPIDGLLVSSDCGYIVDSLKFTYNSFCVNMMSDFVRIGWCAVAVAICSIVGMVVSYIFSTWFSDVQKNNKWFEEGYSGQDYVEAVQIQSTDQIKDIQKRSFELGRQQEVVDIGKEFQKLGHFHSYVGKSKKNEAQFQQKDRKKINKVDSDDSSQQQNPYTKEINE